MSVSSASVGFCPSDRMTVPNSLLDMVPSPSLSNSVKASLNSTKNFYRVQIRCASDRFKIIRNNLNPEYFSVTIMRHAINFRTIEMLADLEPSGTKRYTFETSRQVLTSIDTTRLTLCCSLLFVYC